MEQEILSPIPLLTPRGAITEEGWARRPYWQFSASDTKKALLKQADRYIITDPENGLTITVDMLILGLRRFFSIAFVDMKNGHIGRAEAEGISRGKDACDVIAWACLYQAVWSQRINQCISSCRDTAFEVG